MQENPICCPECHTILAVSGTEGERACPVCGYRYAVREGIIDFAPEDHFYWGEVAQETMVKVNQAAQTDGWFKAFVENVVAGKNPRDMAGYLLDPVRIAGLFHFYSPQRNEVCVDLGSGWGPISFGLSKFYKTVYSMDGVYERLRFQAIRAEQEGIENVKILKGSLLKLPLPDNFADTVIVNGLLEWIGLSDEVTPPRELQLNFLNEVRRVLKPEGKLFIGIENRTGVQFFMGSEDHSGLRFTSLMPRWLAGRVVRNARSENEDTFFDSGKNDYRTLTYSYWGYGKLLRKAGFLQPDIYWTWPSYNEPRVSGTLDGNSVGFYLGTVEGEMKDGFRRMLIRLARHMPRPVLGLLMKIFSPHFLILTGKDRRNGGLQEEVLGANTRGSLLRTTLNAPRNLNTDYLLLDGKGVAKKVSVEPLIKNSHPRFHLEEQKGARGRPLHVDSPKEAALAARWLANFQQRNRQGEWDRAETEAEIAQLVENARPSMNDLSDLLDRFAAIYGSLVGGRPIPIVKEQGDFVPQNILVAQSGAMEVTGWAHSRPAGSPFMDAGSFLLSLDSPDLADVFAREYCRIVDLPLQLAPAYYILRMLASDYAAAGINADTYLGYAYWRPRLRRALEKATAEMARTAMATVK